MMPRIGRQTFVALTCLAFLPALARADDTELREYAIFIEGKESGTSRMTMIQKDDGSAYMSGTVELKFRQIIVDYTLKVESQEWWKNGQLVAMKTTCIENGKKTELTVALDNNQLRMRFNGKDTPLKREVWPTSYWKLADARFHNKQIPVLEADTGKELLCELKYIGLEKLKVGELQDCYHFRVVSASSSPTDLWFDRYHRLVRQEFTESGHKTIVQLTKITR